MQVLGIDIGGTGIKGAPVDLDSGKLLADRKKIATPQPATPEAVTEVVREVVSRFKGRVGVRTEVGIGTSVEIEVPVSLSSVRSILLAAGDLLIWVPLEAVHSAMRLDADVIAWLKKRGKGYQTRVNSILRQTMLADTKRA